MTTRVRLGRLDDLTGGTNQFGLWVADPQGTVIIDGTSSVFKTLASGTLSITIAAGDMGDTESLVLGGLGAQTSTPGHISFIATSLSATSRRFGSTYIGAAGIVKYAATTSGGSPNSQSGTFDWTAMVATILTSEDLVEVRLTASNATAVDQDFHCYFYLLQEVAF